MAHLQHAVASLRIAGDDLVPDEISTLLGAAPTHAQTRGQESHSSLDAPALHSLGSGGFTLLIPSRKTSIGKLRNCLESSPMI